LGVVSGAMKGCVFHIVAVVGLLAACGRSEDFERVEPPMEPEAVLVPGGGPGAELFGEYGGVKVSRADVDLLAAEGHDDETRAKVVALRRKLAFKAAQQGKGSDDAVAFAFRQGLARAWLEQKFEIEHTPDSVPLEEWRKLYMDRRVRPKFDHRDTYFVIDAQIICCSEIGDGCRRTDRYQSCFNETQAKAQEVHTSLLLIDPQTPEQFEKSAREIAKGMVEVGVQEYSFQYDFSKSWERQRGYDVVDEAVAQGARATGVGAFSAPIRSAFGWHILYVKEFLPEVSLPFDHPEVLATLKKEFHGYLRDKDVIRYIQETGRQFGIRVDVDALRAVNWEQLSGLKP